MKGIKKRETAKEVCCTSGFENEKQHEKCLAFSQQKTYGPEQPFTGKLDA